METAFFNMRMNIALLGIVILIIFGMVILSWLTSDDIPDQTSPTNVPNQSQSTIAQPPSGRIAFASDRDGDDEIYVMNTDGSGIVQLTHNEHDDVHPSWSPDGQRIMFSSRRENDHNIRIYDTYIMNADGSGIERLAEDIFGWLSPEWSPDGNRIVFSARGEIYVTNVDGSSLNRLTNNNEISGAFQVYADNDGEGFPDIYSMDEDGNVELLVYSEYDEDVGYRKFYARNADGDFDRISDFDDLIEIYSPSDYQDCCASWSPDGRRIAFLSSRYGDSDIYLMNTDGSGVEQLTHSQNEEWSPVWSPDGQRIAFSSTEDGDHEIYLINVDGSNARLLTDNEHSDATPSWSPDSDRIAFTSNRDGDMGIYVMNADGSGVVRLGEGYMPAWSPLLD